MSYCAEAATFLTCGNEGDVYMVPFGADVNAGCTVLLCYPIVQC